VKARRVRRRDLAETSFSSPGGAVSQKSSQRRDQEEKERPCWCSRDGDGNTREGEGKGSSVRPRDQSDGRPNGPEIREPGLGEASWMIRLVSSRAIGRSRGQGEGTSLVGPRPKDPFDDRGAA